MRLFTRSEKVSSYIPIATLSLISFLILCFIFQSKIGGTDNNFSAIASLFSVSRQAIVNGHVTRLITANFFHLNHGHLLSNIFGLFFFSSLLEILLGRTRAIIVILLSSIGGTIGSISFHMVDWMVGSSTILFGVFGGLGVLILRYRIEFKNHFATVLISWCISLIPLTTLGYLSMKIVDQGAHIGGFIAGVLTTLILVYPHPIAELSKPLGVKGKIILVVLIVVFGLSFFKEIVPLLYLLK